MKYVYVYRREKIYIISLNLRKNVCNLHCYFSFKIETLLTLTQFQLLNMYFVDNFFYDTC